MSVYVERQWMCLPAPRKLFSGPCNARGFQEALLLKSLKIVFKDHGNAPFVSFDVISLTRTCRMDALFELLQYNGRRHTFQI
jgi:hypothetical protein